MYLFIHKKTQLQYSKENYNTLKTTIDMYSRNKQIQDATDKTNFIYW